MTLREARRKLGSRSRRRANTNGKTSGKVTKSSRSIPRRNPAPVKQYTKLGVRRLMKEAGVWK